MLEGLGRSGFQMEVWQLRVGEIKKKKEKIKEKQLEPALALAGPACYQLV